MKKTSFLSLAAFSLFSLAGCSSGGDSEQSSTGDGDGVEAGDGDATIGDGDNTPGDGDNTPGDGDGTGDGDNTPGDGDGSGDGDNTPGDGDGDSTDDGDAPDLKLEPIDPGESEFGKHCQYGDEKLAAGTTVFSDGCNLCVCYEDGIECRENWECMEDTPADCDGLHHRESRVSNDGQCDLAELCVDGEIKAEDSCSQGENPNGPAGCNSGDIRFEHGDRMSDGGDQGACYCLNGEQVCLF